MFILFLDTLKMYTHIRTKIQRFVPWNKATLLFSCLQMLELPPSNTHAVLEGVTPIFANIYCFGCHRSFHIILVLVK